MISSKKRILPLTFILIFTSILTLLVPAGAAADLNTEDAEFPKEYVDALGRKLIIESEVKTIISLAPAVTEIIYALGMEDKLIAVSSACDYPRAAREKESIGRVAEPNLEKIISLEPDLVIAESITRIESVKRLSELGIKNIGFKPESINDTIEMIEDISYLISAEKKGRELSLELKSEYQSLKNLVADKLKNNDRKRVFYEVWPKPLYTAGSSTFVDSLIQEAGGYNIGRKAKGAWPTFSLESLIAADPEVYISTAHSNTGVGKAEKLKQKELLKGVSAFKNNQVYQIDPDLINRPSPRIIEAYKQLIKIIFPELKKEIE